MRKLAFILCLLVLPIPCLAQADYQLRPLMHWQTQHLAGWSVLPDVTAQPLCTLQVAGWVTKDGGWKEIMGGIRACTDGSIKPIVDLRAYSAGTWTDLYAELFIRPDLAITSIFVTAPVGRNSRIRIGVESEFVTAIAANIKSRVGIGPRVSIKIPKLPLTIATVYYFNIGAKPIIRTYVLYKPG